MKNKINLSRTNLIVLRKTQYRESSIIVAGLAPELGRMDVVVKGAKKLTKKSFPSVDLFREISIEISNRKNSLHSVYSADLISNNDNIASFHSNYLIACDISKFILRSSHPELASPMLYKALKNIFHTLSIDKCEPYYLSLIKLIFLHEHGILPQFSESEKEQKNLLSQLLNHALGNGELPELDDKYWKELDKWIDQCLLGFAHL